MRSRLLILCPGQGDQHAQMFDLARGEPRAAALLDSLALPPLRHMFDNRSAQQLIVASTLATWEALRDKVPPPALVAGYSIGELSAYGVAGAYTPAQTLALAEARARLMDACLDAQPDQALAALSGLPLRQAAILCAGQSCHVAIETGADSCIAGGPAAALAALEAQTVAAGGRCKRLPVAVASHTPYMAAAVAPFAKLLGDADFAPMRAPVVAGISALAGSGKAQAVEHLSRQLAETILWAGCMDTCAEAGVTVALELGPGAALSRMLRARHPHIACRSAAEFRSLAGVVGWLERECG
ncbi:ACP S-malonyltransferase [Rugamonas sp. CCM 8940]|uniref:ACP S-malonyltransferase n=1 Tax=Rugamonas sp. CCM 8940 TaxID=2765359 RepID=UPI0018F5A80C|nr:acyltransferase domain-containing protein [Rugamonas sp. CCM 8940]MBJ7312639.1 acyltransferase domain-containing protein [Rugamonas sp. CCM 8940]